MLFNSYIFWAFFLIVLLGYRLLPHRGQNLLLLVASYVFYGYWDVRFLSLIFISTVVDYMVANRLHESEDPGKRKIWVSISIITNLGILGFFKYWGFFVSEANEFLMTLGFNSSLPVLSIVLPVGISFYTFQTMSYTIDVYRKHTEPVRNPLDFALYVSFFPQLVAGPIERSSHLIPQISNPRRITSACWHEGIFLILKGLFLKVVIADNMAVIANAAFAKPVDSLTGTEVFVGVYAFAFQIYGDFAGYSAIAKGTARLMGFDLMWNFKNPYFSVSPSDFWRRWHISLSSWLRDYLYIPLGGNRQGSGKTFRNLMLTMGLGGLWHGAGWNFIVWGIYHGFLLIAYRMAGIKDDETSGLRKYLSIFLMFHLICISWLMFRATSLDQILGMLSRVFVGGISSDFAAYGFGLILFFVSPLLIYEAWIEKKGDPFALLKSPVTVQISIAAFLICMLVVFPAPQRQEFIYFQF